MPACQIPCTQPTTARNMYKRLPKALTTQPDLFSTDAAPFFGTQKSMNGSIHPFVRTHHTMIHPATIRPPWQVRPMLLLSCWPPEQTRTLDVRREKRRWI